MLKLNICYIIYDKTFKQKPLNANYIALYMSLSTLF